jgi:predicted dehydrogenase
MDCTMDDGPLQVGVIGLGQQWRRRYKPALRALRDRFTVRLLCDQVHGLAAREARGLGCDAVLGPTELLDNDAIQAVLLLDAQWFRLWPLEQACRSGKPVYCLGDVAVGEKDLPGLVQQVRESRLPVMAGFGPREAWVTAALRDLLAGPLGPASGVVCNFVQPHPGAGAAASPDAGLIDWCAGVVGAEPVSVVATRTEDGSFTSLLLEFPEGRRAQLTGWGASAVWHAPRLEVIAERGWAQAELPGRLRSVDADGWHSESRRGRPPEQLLLERFAQSVRAGQPPQPNLEDACRVVAWLHAAEQSHKEGRRVQVGEGPVRPSSA